MLTFRSFASTSFASFCFCFACCILSHTSSYSKTDESTFISFSISFFCVFDSSTFWATIRLLVATLLLLDAVGEASTGSSSSSDAKAAERLSDGVSPTGLDAAFALLFVRENETFMSASARARTRR